MRRKKMVKKRASRQQNARRVANPLIIAAPVVDSDNANPTGGISPREIEATILSEFGRDPEPENPEPQIALESLIGVIATRLDHPDAANDPRELSVFFYSDRARDLAARVGARREPILDSGRVRLSGKLWIAPAAMTMGYCVDLPVTEPDKVFEIVCHWSLGALPAFIYDPTAAMEEVRFYPSGLAHPELVHRVVMSGKKFSIKALEKALEDFHASFIVTPDAAGPSMNPWSKPRKYFPRPNTETFLQGWLASIIHTAFSSGLIVKPEVRGVEGRCDLWVLSRSAAAANNLISHAALELKVLRSFSTGGRRVPAMVNVEAIAKGLRQVTAYMSEQSAQHGLLCCYDMRTPQQSDGMNCLAPIESKAKKRKIRLHLFRMFGSSEDYRQFKYKEN